MRELGVVKDEGREFHGLVFDEIDPETKQRDTVKRYRSEKVAEDDSWRHEKITLEPINPAFEPIVLTGTDEGDLQVIAELVEVLKVHREGE